MYPSTNTASLTQHTPVPEIRITRGGTRTGSDRRSWLHSLFRGGARGRSGPGWKSSRGGRDLVPAAGEVSEDKGAAVSAAPSIAVLAPAWDPRACSTNGGGMALPETMNVWHVSCLTLTHRLGVTPTGRSMPVRGRAVPALRDSATAVRRAIVDGTQGAEHPAIAGDDEQARNQGVTGSAKKRATARTPGPSLARHRPCLKETSSRRGDCSTGRPCWLAPLGAQRPGWSGRSIVGSGAGENP